MDPVENTLGADLLSDPKTEVLRRRKVMELRRCFILWLLVLATERIEARCSGVPAPAVPVTCRNRG